MRLEYSEKLVNEGEPEERPGALEGRRGHRLEGLSHAAHLANYVRDYGLNLGELEINFIIFIDAAIFHSHKC